MEFLAFKKLKQILQVRFHFVKWSFLSFHKREISSEHFKWIRCNKIENHLARKFLEFEWISTYSIIFFTINDTLEYKRSIFHHKSMWVWMLDASKRLFDVINLLISQGSLYYVVWLVIFYAFLLIFPLKSLIIFPEIPGNLVLIPGNFPDGKNDQFPGAREREFPGVSSLVRTSNLRFPSFSTDWKLNVYSVASTCYN